MLKTNTRKARENIRAYIVDNFDASSYTETPPETFPAIAAYILETFHDEKCKHDLQYKAGRISKQELFFDWAAGLPSLLDTCYFYNRSALDDLGAILEESESEKARYSESDAERLLTILIYRELLKGADENVKNARTKND